MRLLHLSDTHNLHRQLTNLAAADVIIHSGDISMAGTPDEVMDFIDWFGSLDYRYKIFIAGNHDDALDGKDPERIQSFLPDNCYYLYRSGIVIEGVKFWGIPLFVSDDIAGLYPQMMNEIPLDTDVLITHRPPLGILDKAKIYYGSLDLLNAVRKVCPCYHLFGHIHDSYGIEESKHTTFVNAALVDENYRPLRNPYVFEI